MRSHHLQSLPLIAESARAAMSNNMGFGITHRHVMFIKKWPHHIKQLLEILQAICQEHYIISVRLSKFLT